MEKDYKYAIFIGRFQPFHKAHEEVVQQGLEIADKVLIFIGSSHAAPTIKNPFTFEQRRDLIKQCFPDKFLYPESDIYTSHDKIVILGIRDYYYSDNMWVADIQAKTDQHMQEGDSVALLGNYKDESSYYLKYFPQWEFVPTRTKLLMNATDIRVQLFAKRFSKTWDDKAQLRESIDNYHTDLPKPISEFLKEFQKSTAYLDRLEEYKHYKAYWSLAEKYPYPITSITADAVVICSGHVLVIKRKFNPGKNLYALPGGFIRPKERIKDAAIRELKEETGIRVDKIILKSNVVGDKVFDHPNRSLRGRVVTHAYHVKLKDGRLPEVKGNSDAEHAFWMPLMDVVKREDEFFEDHAHIINYFVHK